MKKNNKGFSLVELIIVIAIMAILAGALAPSLIKYINKSRRSTDISNADTIATAVTSALADETGYDECTGSYTSSDLVDASKDSFTAITASTLGTNSLKGKYDTAKGCDFDVVIDKANNKITISCGGTEDQLYPETTGIYAD